MSIESGNRQQGAQPESNQSDQWAQAMHHKTAETARPPVEHRDDESGDAARAELARMRDADNKRKTRNKWIGGGVAGLLLAGGGVFAGSKLAGGEADPSPDSNKPAAEAPANPGEDAPVNENPAEPIAENPGTSPTDLPPSEEDTPTEGAENPDFIDLTTAENREEASVEDILEFYSGLDKRWVEGTGDGAGVNYVSNFLVERGAGTPIIENADEIIQKSGLQLTYWDEVAGETILSAEDTMNETLATTLNTYLANKDELALDIDNVDPVNRYFFNAAGKYTIRGMEEALYNPELCYDQYDCLKAYENEDFRQIFEEVDALPDGSAITSARVGTSTAGRYAKEVIIGYKTPGAENSEVVRFYLENGFTLYPMQFDASYLENSSTRAASLNQVYRGMPHGDSAEAYLYLSNDEQIQDKIGNPNLQ